MQLRIAAEDKRRSSSTIDCDDVLLIVRLILFGPWDLEADELELEVDELVTCDCSIATNVSDSSPSSLDWSSPPSDESSVLDSSSPLSSDVSSSLSIIL